MTRKELSDFLTQCPETARIVIQTERGLSDVIVYPADFVPIDVDTNPNGRIINGLVVFSPVQPSE